MREKEGGRYRGRKRDTQRENVNKYIKESLLLLGFNKFLVHRVFIYKDFYIVLLVIQKSSETQYKSSVHTCRIPVSPT